MNDFSLVPIARYHGDFPAKFGIPRQAGVVEALEGRIVFEPEYRCADALRGIEGFSHLWLIWQFSEAVREGWSPTVRPPRLGGNRRMGVFATRSPFRPNSLGLSCVRLLDMESDAKLGSILRVSGADLMDGTPIFDIKPYLPYADCVPQASAGFAPDSGEKLKVQILPEAERMIPNGKLPALIGVLENDPRPRYQADGRVYVMEFAGTELSFSVHGDVLTVEKVIETFTI